MAKHGNKGVQRQRLNTKARNIAKGSRTKADRRMNYLMAANNPFKVGVKNIGRQMMRMFIRSSHRKPHQGAAECARRVRQGNIDWEQKNRDWPTWKKGRVAVS